MYGVDVGDVFWDDLVVCEEFFFDVVVVDDENVGVGEVGDFFKVGIVVVYEDGVLEVYVRDGKVGELFVVGVGVVGLEEIKFVCFEMCVDFGCGCEDVFDFEIYDVCYGIEKID